MFWLAMGALLVLLVGDYAVWAYAVHDDGGALTAITVVVFYGLLAVLLGLGVIRITRWRRRRRVG